MRSVTIPSRFNLLSTGSVALGAFTDLKDASGPRRFSMLAYSGAIFDVGFGKAAVQLATMAIPDDGVPIFRQHDPNKFVGRSTGISTEGGALAIDGQFFDVAEAEEVASLSDQGAGWQASIGFAISFDDIDDIERGESREVNGRLLDGPFLLLKNTTLKESSFVPLGADPSTSAVALSGSDYQTVQLERSKEARMAEAEALQQERERVKGLTSAFAKDAGFALEAINEGLSLLEAKARYSDRVIAQGEAAAIEAAAALEVSACRIAELEAKLAQAEKPRANPAGSLAITGAGDGSAPPSSDPVSQWQAAMCAEVKKLSDLRINGATRGGGLQLSQGANVRAQAICNLALRSPDLHQDFLAASNVKG